MIRAKYFRMVVIGILCFSLMPGLSAFAEKDKDQDNSSDCRGLPSYSALKTALDKAVADEKSGLNLHMWGTIVNRDGIVCAVAFSGVSRGAQWPGSRVISAQKANTANSFSLDALATTNGSGPGELPLNKPAGLALSTANLYS